MIHLFQQINSSRICLRCYMTLTCIHLIVASVYIRMHPPVQSIVSESWQWACNSFIVVVQLQICNGKQVKWQHSTCACSHSPITFGQFSGCVAWQIHQTCCFQPQEMSAEDKNWAPFFPGCCHPQNSRKLMENNADITSFSKYLLGFMYVQLLLSIQQPGCAGGREGHVLMEIHNSHISSTWLNCLQH